MIKVGFFSFPGESFCSFFFSLSFAVNKLFFVCLICCIFTSFFNICANTNFHLFINCDKIPSSISWMNFPPDSRPHQAANSDYPLRLGVRMCHYLPFTAQNVQGFFLFFFLSFAVTISSFLSQVEIKLDNNWTIHHSSAKGTRTRLCRLSPLHW